MLSNCAVIGITYSIVERDHFAEESLVKLATALFLIWASEVICQKFNKCPPGECLICCEELTRQSMVLACSHGFHEECLWRWVYQKRCCPRCGQAI